MGANVFEMENAYKEWKTENAMSQERKSQQKILFEEINFLDCCLKEFANKEDWHMYSFVLNKCFSYIEIAYKTGLLNTDEYEREMEYLL